jgi:hypothetical protein
MTTPFFFYNVLRFANKNVAKTAPTAHKHSKPGHQLIRASPSPPVLGGYQKLEKTPGGYQGGS